MNVADGFVIALFAQRLLDHGIEGVLLIGGCQWRTAAEHSLHEIIFQFFRIFGIVKHTM